MSILFVHILWIFPQFFVDFLFFVCYSLNKRRWIYEFCNKIKRSANYEKSVNFPNLDILYKIFDILQTEPNFFFQDEITDTGSSLEFDSNQLILDMYNKLDNEDKAEIRGEMRQMLKADKYSKSTPSDK